MASLLEKVQVLISADLNRLVDRALQSNEPAVFQHHIREMQSLQEQLGDQLAGVKRGCRADAAAQRRGSKPWSCSKTRTSTACCSAGLQEEALAAQDRLNQARLTAAKLTEQVERLEAQYAELAEGKARLDARVTALQQTEPEVGSLVSLARAKEATATAAQSLDDLAGTGDPDAARVVDSIRQRLAEAEAKMQALEQSGLAHGETPEVLKRKELESQLEARKARAWDCRRATGGDGYEQLAPIIGTLAGGLLAIGLAIYFWVAAGGRRTQAMFFTILGLVLLVVSGGLA